jgi:hypothetical protein
MFGVVQRLSAAWVVRIPVISQRHLRRLPPDLQADQLEWTSTTVHIDAHSRGPYAGAQNPGTEWRPTAPRSG